MYLAGMDVKDVHMTDLIEGRETLEDVNMIVFPGGFSNSDVLGSAKGWAGALLTTRKPSRRSTVLRPSRHAVAGRLQRLPADDRARARHARPRA
ncbi:MAG: phosphoribosylformylglycinamidine synthase subunit PurQ [Alistipes sp.]